VSYRRQPPPETRTQQNHNIPDPVPQFIHNSHNGMEMIASSAEKSTEKGGIISNMLRNDAWGTFFLRV